MNREEKIERIRMLLLSQTYHGIERIVMDIVNEVVDGNGRIPKEKWDECMTEGLPDWFTQTNNFNADLFIEVIAGLIRKHQLRPIYGRTELIYVEVSCAKENEIS